MPEPIIFRGNGKLLVTGEYLVLDGAAALAVPTRLGQTLRVEPTGENRLEWDSFDRDGNRWFSAIFSHQMKIVHTDGPAIAETLKKILLSASELNPSFRPGGQRAETRLEFGRDWGLGSSSTLIYTVARWASVDPFRLLEMTFGGSGYDIACAFASGPVFYRKINHLPQWKDAGFYPPFTSDLFFVHLGRKQDTRQAVAAYRSANSIQIPEAVKTADTITAEMIACRNTGDFSRLVTEHERILSDILGIAPVKRRLFPDYPGAVKSLGAWGGDFVLACGSEAPGYFPSKGYPTVIPYEELILGG